MHTGVFRLALLGALVMLAATPFMTISASTCSPLEAPAIIAFELARSLSDVQQVLGRPGEACHALIAPQLDQANIIDTFVYIPAYTAFFALVAYGLAGPARRAGLLAAGLTLACALADLIENASLLKLSAAPDEPTAFLPALIIATNVKWVGLGLVTCFCGLMLNRRGGLWRLALPVCCLPLAVSVFAIIDPRAAGPFFLYGLAGSSLFLLLVAVQGALRPPRSTSAAAPES